MTAARDGFSRKYMELVSDRTRHFWKRVGPQPFDTWCDNRYNRLHGPLAQLAEQLTLNQQVTGSIPVRLTRKRS